MPFTEYFALLADFAIACFHGTAINIVSARGQHREIYACLKTVLVRVVMLRRNTLRRKSHASDYMQIYLQGHICTAQKKQPTEGCIVVVILAFSSMIDLLLVKW